jgi:3-oxoacyl-[acyl-carrier-protein] synthase II
MKRRVVITGIGVVAPGGVGIDGFWSRVKDGRPAARQVKRLGTDGLPAPIAAEVDGFDPAEFMPRKWVARTERCAQFALAAAMLAGRDAGVTPGDPAMSRAGVFDGTASGGFGAICDQHRRFMASGGRRVDPTGLIREMNGNASSSIALHFRSHGPAVTFSQGCVSSASAIHYGFRTIQSGELDLAIVGGSEAPVVKELLLLFAKTHLLSAGRDDPAAACKPFDTRRDGIVLGEGGAYLVMEEAGRALKRNASIYAEMSGAAETNDAHHPTAPEPQGDMIAAAMRLALQEAALQPADVDYVNAHGTATKLNDVVEARAMRKVFSARGGTVAVSSTKATTGHLLGACGALELAVCALAIRHQWLPPTANLEQVDPSCDLTHIACRGRAARIRAAMSNTFSLGGRNAALVIQEFHPSRKGG